MSELLEKEEVLTLEMNGEIRDFIDSISTKELRLEPIGFITVSKIGAMHYYILCVGYDQINIVKGLYLVHAVKYVYPKAKLLHVSTKMILPLDSIAGHISVETPCTEHDIEQYYKHYHPRIGVSSRPVAVILVDNMKKFYVVKNMIVHPDAKPYFTIKPYINDSEASNKMNLGGWSNFHESNILEEELLKYAYYSNHMEQVIVYLTPLAVAEQVANGVNFKYIVDKKYNKEERGEIKLISFTVQNGQDNWPPHGISLDVKKIKITNYKEKDLNGSDVN